VVANNKSTYYGGAVTHTALVPAGQAELGAVNFEKWWDNQLQKSLTANDLPPVEAKTTGVSLPGRL